MRCLPTSAFPPALPLVCFGTFLLLSKHVLQGQAVPHQQMRKATWYCAGPVRLLTNPGAAGYVQNPISMYYCYAASTDGRGAEGDQSRTPRDSCGAQPTSSGRGGGAQVCSAADRPQGDCGSSHAASGRRDGGPPGSRAGGGAPPAGRLQRCIAEVTNTPWGARVTFVFDPGEQAVPKAMHVSPLMDMRSTWCAGLLALHWDSGALMYLYVIAWFEAALQTEM